MSESNFSYLSSIKDNSWSKATLSSKRGTVESKATSMPTKRGTVELSWCSNIVTWYDKKIVTNMKSLPLANHQIHALSMVITSIKENCVETNTHRLYGKPNTPSPYLEIDYSWFNLGIYHRYKASSQDEKDWRKAKEKEQEQLRQQVAQDQVPVFFPNTNDMAIAYQLQRLQKPRCCFCSCILLQNNWCFQNQVFLAI